MPRVNELTAWRPKKASLREQIDEEIARFEALRDRRLPQAPEPEMPKWQPPEQRLAPTVEAPPVEVVQPIPRVTPPVVTRPLPQEIEPVVALPAPVEALPAPKEEPPAMPFWQRALEIFSAPFRWVEETIIKPGMAVLGTTLGFVPEVERKPGEDYWEWKKRSWGEWAPPGIDIPVPWSDEPVRLDVRGIMEFAPWLLIPGAGQVGGGARAARGVAGLAGKISRPLGYAIEYSPWGLVEKTAGAAMRAGFKAAGKVGTRISERVGREVFGEVPKAPVSPAVQRVTTWFDDVIAPARKEFERKLPGGLRSRQEAAVSKVAAKFRAGEITSEQYIRQSKQALAKVGGIRAGFAKKAPQEVLDDIEELCHLIDKKAAYNLVDLDTVDAFRNTLLGVDIPEPHHIKEFGKVFGPKFAETMRRVTQKPPSNWQKAVDAANVPRAVLASFDLSATARQGLILSAMRPHKVPGWFARQVKSFFSERLALQADDAMRADPLFDDFLRDAGEAYFSLRGAEALKRRIEPYMTTYAQRLPIIGGMIRRSERAFITYINQASFGTYKAGRAAILAQRGGQKELQSLGKFIRLAIGRGDIPANLNRYAPALNAVLFSPRLQAATLELPFQIGRMFLSGNPYLRKEAARALVTFVGGGASLLGILHASGVSKVELDPRSGDFGKIKIGETRLDIWRGYLQYIRFASQLLTGERKSARANMNEAERFEIAWRFLQSKSSPAFGLLVDMLKGETYMGDDLFTSTKSTVRQFRERMMPLAIQDIMDAMEQGGVNGLWTAAPATLGIGVLTFVSDFVRAKQKLARQLGYKTWDEIDPATQRQLLNSNAELQAAEIEFDRKIMGRAWGDWRLAGKAIENMFEEDVGKASAQYRETGDGYQFREKISDAWRGRRGGYAAREKMPQFEDIVRRLQTQDTAEALISLGPEQLAIRAYNEALYGDDMYDEFGDYRFDEAETRKAQLRTQLGNEMFEYVEAYRDIRYEDFPREFQELQRAKRVMRPYWEVRDEMIKIYGKPRTPWQERRLNQAIARVRKRLRLNPEVEKYYQMFYAKPSL